jgi:hypothetical protein
LLEDLEDFALNCIISIIIHPKLSNTTVGADTAACGPQRGWEMVTQSSGRPSPAVGSQRVQPGSPGSLWEADAKVTIFTNQKDTEKICLFSVFS